MIKEQLDEVLSLAAAEAEGLRERLAYLDRVIAAANLVMEYAASIGEIETPYTVPVAEIRNDPPPPPAAPEAPAEEEKEKPGDEDCIHHWVCEGQNGPTSEATCKKCGATQTLRNSSEETVWSKSMTTIKGRIHTMLREAEEDVSTQEVMAMLDAAGMTYSAHNLYNHLRFAGGEPVPGKRGYWRLKTNVGEA